MCVSEFCLWKTGLDCEKGGGLLAEYGAKGFFFFPSASLDQHHVLISISLCLLEVDYGSARPEIPTIIVII